MTSTTDAASSTGTAGYNDACDATQEQGVPCVAEESSCQLSSGIKAFHFNAQCPDAMTEWCTHEPPGAMDTFDVGMGRMTIRAGEETGWWYQPPSLRYPPFLYRRLASGTDFIVATRVTTIEPNNAAGTYNIAGLAVRSAASSTDWDPFDMAEEWIKLEYGYRGAPNENHRGLGVLLGAARGGVAIQLGGDPTDMAPGDRQVEDYVDLAICRKQGEGYTFAYRRASSTDWATLVFDPKELPAIVTDELQVGISAGALNDNYTMNAEFEWLVYAVGALPSDSCRTLIENLVNDNDCSP
jgi:hypothetical protein